MIEASEKLHTIAVDVNGARRTASVEPRTLLVLLPMRMMTRSALGLSARAIPGSLR
jgi:hypothetical protein